MCENKCVRESEMMKQTTNFKRNLPLLAMSVPGMLWLVLFSYLPMFGLILAFKDYNFISGILGSKFVGFKNFQSLFATSDALVITRNTIVYNLAFIVLGLIGSVSLAIIFDSMGRSKLLKVNQTLVLLPYFLSWVVIAYFVSVLLSEDKGVINSIIRLLGGDPVKWYSTPKYWPVILTVTSLWKSMGYDCIIYYATIRGFSSDYYEAARLDGATWFQQIRYITIPLLSSIAVMMSLLKVGHIMHSDFGLFYLVPKNSGLLYSVTSTIDTYVYNGISGAQNFGVTSAISFYQSVIGFILVLTTNAVVKKISPENALF